MTGSTEIRERKAAAAGESGIPSVPTVDAGGRPRSRCTRSHGLIIGPVASSGLIRSWSCSTARSASALDFSSWYCVW